MAVGQNLMGTFWEDYHLLKGFLGSSGVRGFDPLPYSYYQYCSVFNDFRGVFGGFDMFWFKTLGLFNMLFSLVHLSWNKHHFLQSSCRRTTDLPRLYWGNRSRNIQTQSHINSFHNAVKPTHRPHNPRNIPNDSGKQKHIKHVLFSVTNQTNDYKHLNRHWFLCCDAHNQTIQNHQRKGNW